MNGIIGIRNDSPSALALTRSACFYFVRAFAPRIACAKFAPIILIPIAEVFAVLADLIVLGDFAFFEDLRMSLEFALIFPDATASLAA